MVERFKGKPVYRDALSLKWEREAKFVLEISYFGLHGFHGWISSSICTVVDFFALVGSATELGETSIPKVNWFDEYFQDE